LNWHSNRKKKSSRKSEKKKKKKKKKSKKKKKKKKKKKSRSACLHSLAYSLTHSPESSTRPSVTSNTTTTTPVVALLCHILQNWKSLFDKRKNKKKRENIKVHKSVTFRCAFSLFSSFSLGPPYFFQIACLSVLVAVTKRTFQLRRIRDNLRKNGPQEISKM